MYFSAHLWLLVFCFLGTTLCFAQVQQELDIEALLIEQLPEEIAENVDLSEIIERLNQYRKHPLNLNTATAADLNNFIFLTAQQIENLLYHRQVTGDFLSVLELQGIVGFNFQTFNLLQNFVFVEAMSSMKSYTWKNIRADREQMLIIRYGRTLESKAGYNIKDNTRSRYLGDANRYAVRYRWNSDNRIKIALNMEKDAGEPFFRNKQRYGFDFYSGHLEVNALSSSIKKVVIGDYALQFGQGLVLWNGLSFGKGAWVGAIARQGIGLRAYSSLNENNFQRGVAAKLVFGSIEWTPFVAYNSLTGNVANRDDKTIFITSIAVSGLHRTPSELAAKDQVKQLVYGSNLSYQYKRLKVGLTYVGIQFNGYLLKGIPIRNRFDFEGKSQHTIGVSYQNTYRNYYIFGEVAHSFNAGYATLNGLIVSLHPKLSIFVTYRNYGRDYHSFYGQSLGVSSSVSNEKGMYGGVIFHPMRKIEWINYIDVFSYPWLKYNVDGPSEGTDFLSQFSYSWYKKGKLSIRYRYRLKQENQHLVGSNTNALADVSRNQLRLNYEYKLNENWNIRTRAELSLFEKEMSPYSEGYLFYQDLFWKGITKLQFNTRFAYFNTTNYDSRIYAYENDVLYASSFPVYYDKGFRSYLNIRWLASRRLNFWLRYACTYYPNRQSIGAGLEEIQGKIRSDIKIQLRWEW